MVNGLAVLGWGVGGIEAEWRRCSASRLDAPEAIGVRLIGKLPKGDRDHPSDDHADAAARVVGRFVEYCGPGCSELALADRATIGMSPEYGAPPASS
jgi:aconitate hydratase